MSQETGDVDARYLASAAELLAPIKRRCHELLQVRTGQRLLDVGCGPGFDTRAMALAVGEEGFATGVDLDPLMVALARARALESGAESPAGHCVGGALALPFGNRCFDGCRSERLFQHLDRPRAALAEMARVTRKGGNIVVADTDWATLSIDSPYLETERTLARVRIDRQVANGYSGRVLWRLFREVGLEHVRVEAITVLVTDYEVARLIICADAVEEAALESGQVSAEQLADWRGALQEADSRGDFFGSTAIMIAAGRKR